MSKSDCDIINLKISSKKTLFSLRGYRYASGWRRRDEGSSKSYFYTKTWNRPDDVPSDEEPEPQQDLDLWQGQKVERRPLAADEKQIYLGMDEKYYHKKMFNYFSFY